MKRAVQEYKMYAALIQQGAIATNDEIILVRKTHTISMKKNFGYHNSVTLITGEKTITNNTVAPYMAIKITHALGKQYELEILMEILDKNCILVNTDLINIWRDKGQPVMMKTQDYIAYMVYNGNLIPDLRLLRTMPKNNHEWKKIIHAGRRARIDINQVADNHFAKLLIIVVTKKSMQKRPVPFESVRKQNCQ